MELHTSLVSLGYWWVKAQPKDHDICEGASKRIDLFEVRRILPLHKNWWENDARNQKSSCIRTLYQTSFSFLRWVLPSISPALCTWTVPQSHLVLAYTLCYCFCSILSIAVQSCPYRAAPAPLSSQHQPWRPSNFPYHIQSSLFPGHQLHSPSSDGNTRFPRSKIAGQIHSAGNMHFAMPLGSFADRWCSNTVLLSNILQDQKHY